uniref:EFNB2 n=1 Tax=Anisakis simplex TaxID=6269 RepID=A0A0M3J0E8_ANISI
LTAEVDATRCRLCKRNIQTSIQSLWPYPAYKPIAWDKYYVIEQTTEPKSSLTSGIAAGITIGVFVTIFLVTFGCRIYNMRMERLQGTHRSGLRNTSLTGAENFSADFWICGIPREPPPPYEVAIHLPKCALPLSSSPSAPSESQSPQQSPLDASITPRPTLPTIATIS